MDSLASTKEACSLIVLHENAVGLLYLEIDFITFCIYVSLIQENICSIFSSLLKFTLSIFLSYPHDIW